MTDYEKLLNPAQFAAASLGEGPALIVAGAGSGKTRTIVYRLSWLLEHGVPASSILLLTFTRKAAQEMLDRARGLAGDAIDGLRGGTFHAFAYGVLRRYHPLWLGERAFTVMDGPDQLAAVRMCRDRLAIGKGSRGFPKAAAVVSLFSRARNRERSLRDLVERESPHLLPLLADLEKLEAAYQAFKREKGVLDYDDLLFELEALLMQVPELADRLTERYRHILVDEYQDTNLVQARLVRALSGVDRGFAPSVMAVGDEAQSIYSFRGATVQNILAFPDMFPGTRVVTIEENYRSTAPILAVANSVLANAREGYRKALFTRREGGEPVRVYQCASDRTQAEVVANHVTELLGRYRPRDIAVLFRSGYQSFPLELALVKRGIRFSKYGGLKYSEAAHVKDLVAYLKLMVNRLDYPAFCRIANFFPGIGPKTAERVFAAVNDGAESGSLARYRVKFPEFFEELAAIASMAAVVPQGGDVAGLVAEAVEPCKVHLPRLYPEDYPRRQQALESMVTLAMGYDELDLFLADLTLESPEEQETDRETVTLSTIHSAKGLEWRAVLLIDLAEDRFPSRHAASSAAAFEEERRLMYVACTRAREELRLYVPLTVCERGGRGAIPVSASTFVRELPDGLVETWRETFAGRVRPVEGLQGNPMLRSQYDAPRRGSFAARRRGDLDMAQSNRSGLDPWDDASQEDPAPGLPRSPSPREPAGRARAAKASPGRLAAQGEEPEVTDCRVDPAGVDAARGVPAAQALDLLASGRVRYCAHRLFGRGRVLGVEGDRVRLDFPGYGPKTIVADFLIAEVKSNE